MSNANRSLHRDPTMRDVAALAGVSLKTVSRVVNDESGVSATLVDRVLAAVSQLDYQHNTNASNLRRTDRKTATIGLVLDDAANPFAATLHRVIEEIARLRNVLVFAASSDEDAAREGEIVRSLLARRVDGLIIFPAGEDHRYVLRAQRSHRPVVFVDRVAAVPGIDSVVVDNRDGARAAVLHLAARGHQRIAFLGDTPTIWTASERHLGYIAGLAGEGLRLDPALVAMGVAGTDAADRVATALLSGPNPPTAFFAGQNLLTIGVIRALQRLGAQHRIAVAGFDDFPLADLLDPPVTVVAQDFAAIGRAAAELLFARLDGDRSSARRVVIPTRLIPRGSGEIRCP